MWEQNGLRLFYQPFYISKSEQNWPFHSQKGVYYEKNTFSTKNHCSKTKEGYFQISRIKYLDIWLVLPDNSLNANF